MSDGMVAVPQAFCCDVAFHPPLAPCTIFYRTQHLRPLIGRIIRAYE